MKQEREPDNSTIKRIVICKFLGMGSIIQSTPLLMTLKNSYPGVEIIFISAQRNHSLLECFPFIDGILTVNDDSVSQLISSSLNCLIRIWMLRADIFIDLEIHSYFSTLFTVLGFPKYKIGFYRKESSVQLGLYSKMLYFNTKAPAHEIYLQASRLLKCGNSITGLYDFGSSGNNGSMHLLREIGIITGGAADYIVINPNASDLRVERRWPLQNFTGLINAILNEFPDKLIILTGSAGEFSYVESLRHGLDGENPARVVNTAGRLTIKDLAALIRNSILMITNDSGPMHLAFALKKTTIALFGPCSPLEYSSQPNVFYLYKNVYCSPCVHHFSISPCKGDNQCMKLIGVDEVLQKVRSILIGSIQNSPPETGKGILFDSSDSGYPFGIVDRK